MVGRAVATSAGNTAATVGDSGAMKTTGDHVAAPTRGIVATSGAILVVTSAGTASPTTARPPANGRHSGATPTGATAVTNTKPQHTKAGANEIAPAFLV